MSEMALTASRKARLQVMVEAGESGAQARDGPARQPDQVPVGRADRHHLDRHPERHRRRRRVLGAVRALAARDAFTIGDRAGADHRDRRWWSSSSPSSPSSSASWCPSGSARCTRRRSRAWSRGRWSGCRCSTRPFVRAAVVVHRGDAAPARHARRARPQRHRGGDRRQPRGRASTPASSRRRSTRWCATCSASTTGRSAR